jgi:UDP-GlcNAc:undecaprenyl-phosphate GlcNAc-1-phosphate transferase
VVSPFRKLFGQLLATAVLIYMGVHVRLFHEVWLNYIITIAWVVGITNAFNFVDSMDGLAIGLAEIAAAFFMLVTIDSGQLELSMISTILVGVCLGAFFYNATPAIFFLGDSGAQYLGFILAALGIAYNPLGFERLASWYVPILLVGVPIFDMSLVVFSRMRRKKPIYQANLDHTYHRLLILGMKSNRAVLSMHMVAILLGCLAFIALPLPPLIANVIFGAVLLTGGIGILLLDIKYEI